MLALIVFIALVILLGACLLPRKVSVSQEGFVEYIVYGPGPGPWLLGYTGRPRPWFTRRWHPRRRFWVY